MIYLILKKLISSASLINLISKPFFLDNQEKYPGSTGIQCPPAPGPGINF